MYARVAQNLKRSRKEIIVALHKFVFESEGDRRNRRRLREFSGFDFDESDEKFKQKCAFRKANITMAELVSICGLLNISFQEDNLVNHIFENLRKGNLLQANSTDDGHSDEESDDDDVNDDGDAGAAACYNENAADGHDERADTTIQSANVARACQRKQRVDDEAQKEVKKCFLTCRDANGGRATSTPFEFSRFAVNFRDIEDSVKLFDGSDKLLVDRWVSEFDETAMLMHWDQFQMFVFAKKSLRGLAKLFVQSERGITSCQRLKDALKDEFKYSVNSAQLHKQLGERKMKKGEGIYEYFFNMKELASRGSIEDSSLIQYVIDGVSDLNINKTVLYGAKNIRELKEKLRVYETMKDKCRSTTEEKAQNKKDDVCKQKGTKLLNCYNCGEKGHKSAACSNKEKGTKCFQCGQFGHIRKNCVKAQSEKLQGNVRILEMEKIVMNITVRVENRDYVALLDTGSKFNIITDNVLKSIVNPSLSKCSFFF